ncbi:energy-coupling factor transporter transmembrane component T [Roseovarius sp. SK2]|uniref:energy-coupling factor transporter transmembrane component T n=1 Tax=Roseovarius TaxID=74030 RepID=UPI00237BA4D0|nr:energy-coupling factor transporter transmembrane component T [Roseovarius sp. SK2]MDD9726031.1 energy-coupling factor transporter transmembrane component T [Roseovarius sp. SK2]
MSDTRGPATVWTRTLFLWMVALAIALFGVLAPATWLPLLSLLATVLFIATAGPRATLRDARPLAWHAPVLLLGMLIVNGRVDWALALEISVRFMLTAMPIFWLHRLTAPTHLLTLFERVLPFRLRLILLFALRIWPLLLRDMKDILLVARLTGTWPARLRDVRPRHFVHAPGRIMMPLGVRAIRLSDDMARSLEARGLDQL